MCHIFGAQPKLLLKFIYIKEPSKISALSFLTSTCNDTNISKIEFNNLYAQHGNQELFKIVSQFHNCTGDRPFPGKLFSEYSDSVCTLSGIFFPLSSVIE